MKHEKRNQRIMALIAVILLASAYFAFGQSVTTYTCYTEYGTVDTIILKKGKEMGFSSPSKKDTIKVWIEGRFSKYYRENTFYIKVKYDKSIKAGPSNGLQIDLVDIGRVEFEGCAYTVRDNTCSYKLIDNEIMSLSIRGYDLICFVSPSYMRPITYNTAQKPFVNFFVDYYK